MSISRETPLPVLVSLQGNVQSIDMSIDLLEGRTKTSIAVLLSQFMKAFMPKLLSTIKQARKVNTRKMSKEELLATLLSKIMPELEAKRTIEKIISEGAFTLSELIAITVFKTLQNLREDQIHATSYHDNEYEEMLMLLKRLDIIKPRLQVSICPRCANYLLAISSYPPHSAICPKCRSEWVTITLYTIAPSLAKLKIENADLPVFISAYLKTKLMGKVFTDIKIHPNAVLNINNKKAEIDVYIPEFNMAFECKVFENAGARLTRSRLHSIIDKLKFKIETFLKIGVNKIVIATNLPSKSSEILENILRDIITDKYMKDVDLKVIPGDEVTLIETLDNIINSLAEIISKKISKSLRISFEGS